MKKKFGRREGRYAVGTLHSSRGPIPFCFRRNPVKSTGIPPAFGHDGEQTNTNV
jgi:hypothetical protein